MAIPKKASTRIKSTFKKFQKVLSDAKSRDVSESDTVVIILEMLSGMLGYDKFSEITTESAIKGTYVDLAVKVGNENRFLVEAKAIGIDLNDKHVRQAIDYGANLGIEWVILTNGIIWRLYKVHFGQPIDKILISEIDILSSTNKSDNVFECFGILSREGFSKSAINTFVQQQQATSKYFLSALLLNEPVLKCLRLEVRKIAPKLKVDVSELKGILKEEVIKRDLVDSDEAKRTAKTVKRTIKRQEKNRLSKKASKASSTLSEKQNSEV